MTAKLPVHPKVIKPKTVPKPKGKPVAETAISRKKQALPPVERMEKGRRATKVQHDMIVEEVVELLARGLSSWKIVRYISEKWGFGERQAETYIQKAYAVFQSVTPGPAVSAAVALEMLYEYKERARKNGKWMSEIMAIKELKSILVPAKMQFGGDPDGAPIKTEQIGPILSPDTILKAAEILKSVGAVPENDDSNPPE